MWILNCSLDVEDNSLTLGYVSKFSGGPLQLKFINGHTDLNDFDEFLENTLEHYVIGLLTMPELELLEQLTYGFALGYARKKDCKHFLPLATIIEQAYQDICVMSNWIKDLFLDQPQKNTMCRFSINDGTPRLTYKKESSQQVKSIYNYAHLDLDAAHFNMDAFINFCTSTQSPLPQKMTLHQARVAHTLICENVRFACNQKSANLFCFAVKAE
jgi:hypothetical protein